MLYTPNANYNGSDGFIYGVSDGNGGFGSGSVNINVTTVNDPPIANNDDGYETNEDGPRKTTPMPSQPPSAASSMSWPSENRPRDGRLTARLAA